MNMNNNPETIQEINSSILIGHFDFQNTNFVEGRLPIYNSGSSIQNSLVGLIDTKDLAIDIDMNIVKYPQHVLLPKRPMRRHEDKFIALSRWTGVILAVNGDKIRSKVQDMDNDGTQEYFEFTVDDIDLDDHALIQEGAQFYWSVGYEVSNGTRQKTSVIKLKRKIPASDDQKQDIEYRIKNLKNEINWQ